MKVESRTKKSFYETQTLPASLQDRRATSSSTPANPPLHSPFKLLLQLNVLQDLVCNDGPNIDQGTSPRDIIGDLWLSITLSAVRPCVV